MTQFACANQAKEDTCGYNFVGYASPEGINKLINLEDLVKANSVRDFYFGSIRIFNHWERGTQIALRECASIGHNRVIEPNGLIFDFESSNLGLDTAILFNYFGTRSRVVFEATGCGLGFHNDLRILVCCVRGKEFIGISWDGSDLSDAFRQIVNKYFIISDETTRRKFLGYVANSNAD